MIKQEEELRSKQLCTYTILQQNFTDTDIATILLRQVQFMRKFSNVFLLLELGRGRNTSLRTRMEPMLEQQR